MAFIIVLTFLASAFFLIPSVAPDIYYFVDNPEYVVAINTLGIPHPPGYPVMMLVGKLFSAICPCGSTTWRLNVLSALLLSLTTPIVALLLIRLRVTVVVAVASALLFVGTYYIRSTAISIEIYSFQLFTTALFLYVLVRLVEQIDGSNKRNTLWVGLAFGLCVATHPLSVLLTPGLVITFVWLQITWRSRIFAGLISVFLVALIYSYLPIRSHQENTFSVVGHYDAFGIFHPVDLRNINELYAYLSGQQFDSYFFSHGFIPTVKQITEMVTFIGTNYFWVGFAIGLWGCFLISRVGKPYLLGWASFFLLPFYFFATYTAPDKFTMLGILHLLWLYPLAVGLEWLLVDTDSRLSALILGICVLAVFIWNGNQLQTRQDTVLLDYTKAQIHSFPEDAIVIANWTPALRLMYLQHIYKLRLDLKVINVDGYYYDLNQLGEYINRQPVNKNIVVVDPNQLELNVQEIFSVFKMSPIQIHSTLSIPEEVVRLLNLDHNHDVFIAGYLLQR